MIKFKFKNLPISFLKINLYSKLFSNKPIYYLFSINFFNKFNYFLKKISNYIVTSLKFKNIFIKNFLIHKSLSFKKVFYRGKGRINIIKKRYSNIIIYIYGKKN